MNPPRDGALLLMGGMGLQALGVLTIEHQIIHVTVKAKRCT